MTTTKCRQANKFRVTLSPDEKKLIDQFRLLPDDDKRSVMEYIGDAVAVWETAKRQECGLKY